jgi:hypothetical protein
MLKQQQQTNFVPYMTMTKTMYNNKCTHMECDDYLIDATLLYYGGVGFQAIVPFEEFQPEFLNGHHGPYLTSFHYILTFM